jgi:8-oxo-dGTP pyrophosphatase MutT (NUDIX family)
MNIPLFIDTKDNAVRPDLPFVERDAITAVLLDPKSGKYMGLRWKDGSNWETLITGGIEEGQTPEEAARAEIHEETGYKNIQLVKELPPYDSKFFHHGKQVNRYAHFKCFLFELVDDERDSLAEDENAKHECIWLTRQDLEGFHLPEGHRFVFNEALK